jgi:hypothetical protein
MFHDDHIERARRRDKQRPNSKPPVPEFVKQMIVKTMSQRRTSDVKVLDVELTRRVLEKILQEDGKAQERHDEA